MVIHEVCSLLGANKHESAGGRHRDKKVVESLMLSMRLSPDDLQRVNEIMPAVIKLKILPAA